MDKKTILDAIHSYAKESGESLDTFVDLLDIGLAVDKIVRSYSELSPEAVHSLAALDAIKQATIKELPWFVMSMTGADLPEIIFNRGVGSTIKALESVIKLLEKERNEPARHN